MAITSYGGFDGAPITEPQFGLSIPNWSTPMGVVGAGDWQVTAGTNPGQLNIGPGTGWAHGVTTVSDTIESVTQSSLPTGTGATRWDLVAMRRDWQPPGGTAAFTIVKGSTASELPAPATAAGGAGRQVFPGYVHDQPLALVQWTAGYSQPTKIIDLRVWAANGGVYAKDDLVRTFLDQLGTTVTIGETDWQRVLGTNESPAWVRAGVHDRIPVLGVGPIHMGNIGPSPMYFYVQAGSTVIPAEPNGYGTIKLPKPFFGGILAAIPTNGDNAATGRGWYASLGSAGPQLDRFSVNLSNGSGVGYKNQWRCDWIVIGW